MPTFIHPNSDGKPETGVEFQEAWSAAARAAAAAARGSRGHGKNVSRAAGRAAFAAAGGKTNYSRSVQRQKAEQKRLAKQQQTLMTNDRSAAISSAIGNSKRRSPVEKVKVHQGGRPDSKMTVKFTRRHATTGKGKSKTYTPTAASRARLERALGSGKKGTYFSGRSASQSSRMGQDANRGATKTGMLTYSSAKARANKKARRMGY